MATAKLILGIFCLTAFGRSTVPQRNLLIPETDQIVAIASRQVGVREATGNNDGPQVERYLGYVNCKKGAPWCAAFVSWVFKESGYPEPKSAWSPDLFPTNRRVKKIIPGLVFGIYFKEPGRIAHCGIVAEQVKPDGKWLLSIEGNTNVVGSREGDGVYRKLRHLKTINRFAEWRTKGTTKASLTIPAIGKELRHVAVH